MPHDVFISYSSHDKLLADATCATLEAQGIRCWIAPRDARPGAEWAEDIVNAITDCRVVVLVFTADANDSPQVRREVERAVSMGKILIPLRVEDVLPSKAMELFITSTHWLDAFPPPPEPHLQRLSTAVKAFLGNEPPGVIGDATEDTGDKKAPEDSRLSLSPSADTVARSLGTPAPVAEPNVDRVPATQNEKHQFGYEYRSEGQLLGYPVVHIAWGLPRLNGRRQSARGMIAIGDRPHGIISIGTFPVGGIAMGAFPIGLIPVGFLALGIFPVGAIAIGLVAGYGALCLAPVSLGCIAVGYYCWGECALGRYVMTHSGADPEALRFFQPWIGPWIHAVLIPLCFVSYLCSWLGRAFIRMISSRPM